MICRTVLVLWPNLQRACSSGKAVAYLWGWKGRLREYTKLRMPKRAAAVVDCLSLACCSNSRTLWASLFSARHA